MSATEAGRPVLAAAQRLGDLAVRRRVHRRDVDERLVTGAWRRLVFANRDLPGDIVDHRAYALCVLEALHTALRRRDVYAQGSQRWGDPRARLLDGPGWELARPRVLTALRLSEEPTAHLGDLADRLDAAYLDLAARLPPAADDREAAVRLEAGPDGRMRLHLTRLDAIAEPPSLVGLRELVTRRLPQVDLPEVLLDLDYWVLVPR